MSDSPDIKFSPETIIQYLESAPIGILIFSGNFDIDFINENFIHFGLLKNDREDYLGSSLLQSSFVKELNIYKELQKTSAGIPFEKEIKSLKMIEGSEISMMVKCAPMLQDELFKGGILIIEDMKIAGDIIRKSRTRLNVFEEAFKTVYDIYFISDADLNVKSFFNTKNSAAFPDDTDYTGMNLRDIFHNHVAELEQFSEHKKNISSKIEVSLQKNNYIFQLRIIPIFTASKVASVVLTLRDITKNSTEGIKQEDEIAELKQYQFITSAITDAVISTDLSGNVVFWNKSAEKLFHYTRSEVYGKFIGKIIRPFSIKNFEDIKRDILKGTVWESELKIINAINEEEYISVRISAVHDTNKDTIVILCSSVTERMKVERELRISEERFRNIVINANELICNLDLNGNVIFVNPHFINTFGYTEGELLQKNIKDLIDPEFYSKGELSLPDLASENIKNMELSFISKSGRKFFTLANFSPILNYDNTPRYFNGIFTDITEKKEAEKDLLMIRSVYEASKDGISVEVNRKFILVNDSFARMFGFDNINEVTGKDSLDIVSNGDIPKVAKYIQERENKLNAPNNYEFLGKRKDGSSFHVETSVTSYESEGKIYIVSVCRDITERKRAQEAIKDSEERYRSIIENIDDFLWTAELLNGRMRPVFYTSTVKKITGYRQEEFIADSKLWMKLIHPDDSILVKRKLRLLFNDKARTSDEIDFRIIDRSGNVVSVRNRISIKRNSEGNPFKVFGLVSDISMSKKAEEDLKKSAEGLKEINAAKDKFISIISHDLRTPFSSILGFTDILLSEKDIPEEQRTQYINFIQESSRNMLALVNSLLDWTRLQTGRIKFEPERLNVIVVIEKALNNMRGTAIQKSISLKNNVEQKLFVYADSSLLMQVFNNLLSNAIKFTRNNGIIFISAIPNEKLNQIQFIVKDSGIGIKKEDIGKLFKLDTKFTTDGTSGEKGSGLGLSLVHDIIVKHGGKIWVESEYGKGTEFHFTIPVASANILLVDDNKTDRLLYSKILKKIIPNYSVVLADNGKDAFVHILNSTPALVITDHNMPVMSGYDLVKKIKSSEIKGKPPVLVLSADITKNISDEYRELGIEFIFQKPVNLSIFKEAIEKSLRKALFN